MTALADRPRLLASLSPSEKHQMLYRLAVERPEIFDVLAGVTLSLREKAQKDQDQDGEPS
jgi:hypothetical protein